MHTLAAATEIVYPPLPTWLIVISIFIAAVILAGIGAFIWWGTQPPRGPAPPDLRRSSRRQKRRRDRARRDG